MELQPLSIVFIYLSVLLTALWPGPIYSYKKHNLKIINNIIYISLIIDVTSRLTKLASFKGFEFFTNFSRKAIRAVINCNRPSAVSILKPGILVSESLAGQDTMVGFGVFGSRKPSCNESKYL